jgi:hypothetical protein
MYVLKDMNGQDLFGPRIGEREIPPSGEELCMRRESIRIDVQIAGLGSSTTSDLNAVRADCRSVVEAEQQAQPKRK